LRTFLSEKLNDGLEELRQKKTIGQSLDACAKITGSLQDPEFVRLKHYENDLPELFILSQVDLIEDPKAHETTITLNHADGVRCPRCWRWVPELVETDAWGPVSPRCSESLEQISLHT
jgi:isoleucyl-tRNA synthetase